MTAEEFFRRAVDALLRAGVKDSRCSSCEHNEFRVLPFLVMQRMILPEEIGVVVQESRVDFEGPALPCVARTCKRCGHLTFYSAKVLGLLESAPAPGVN